MLAALTETAARDLHAIWDYIADERSPDIADRIFGELLDECERLAHEPGMGYTRADLVQDHTVDSGSASG